MVPNDFQSENHFYRWEEERSSFHLNWAHTASQNSFTIWSWANLFRLLWDIQIIEHQSLPFSNHRLQPAALQKSKKSLPTAVTNNTKITCTKPMVFAVFAVGFQPRRWKSLTDWVNCRWVTEVASTKMLDEWRDHFTHIRNFTGLVDSSAPETRSTILGHKTSQVYLPKTSLSRKNMWKVL